MVIDNQSLSREETRALVQAMESGVRMLILGEHGEVTLDIGVLTKYNGTGRCTEMWLYRGTAARYREEIRRAYPGSGHMRITTDLELFIEIKSRQL